MQVKLNRGILQLVSEDGSVFADRITAAANYLGTTYNLLTDRQAGEWILENNTAVCRNFKLEFRPCGDGMLVRGTYHNVTGADVGPIDDIRFFRCDLSGLPDKIFCTRFFGVAGNPIGEMRSSIDTYRAVKGARYRSPDFTAFTTAAGSTVCGYVTYREHWGGVEVSGEGHLDAMLFLNEGTVAVGEKIVSDWFCVMPYGDMVKEALPAYAELVLEHSDGKRPEKDVPCGYCNWYYYGGTFNDGDLRENMEFFRAHRQDLPIEYFQVDGGWYGLWGDITPLDRMCGGDMKVFADEIRSNGWKPGIWIAPLGVDEHSNLYREHPEYLVKTKNGDFWKDPFLCIDLSAPGAAEFVAGMFRTLSVDWGYRYIKFDIVSDTLGAGVFYEKSWNSLKNYRRLLEIIRENVTPDTYLLACTVPMNASAGLVDGLRVSCDIFERWDNLREIFNASLKRYFMHGVWFQSDPDCLLVRTAAEEDRQCFRPCTRNETELRTYVTAMAATGGALFFSDKMPLLTENHVEMLSKLYPLNKRAALPLDLMDSYIPGVLDFGVRGGTRTVALVNWGDATGRFTIPDSAGQLTFEFWSQEFLGVTECDLSVEIEPHDCRVYFLTPPADRAIVGTDASIVMDLKQGRKNKPGETLTVALWEWDGYRITKE